MTQHSIETFRTLAPLLMPQLFDLNHLESIDDYDDYALMAFSLAEPIPIETLLDDLEDQMELNILYHMQRSGDTESGQHCCAYSSPSFEHMYKINAQTEIDGLVGTVYVYLFESLEVMLESLKVDVEEHSKLGYFISKMELSQYLSDFM